MAFCPECRETIDAAAITCSHCGYDFTEPAKPPSRFAGWEFSPLAYLALFVASIAAGIGSVLALVAIVITVLQFDLLRGLVLLPLAFLYQFAMLVLFVREYRRSR
jgi:hypothetical protein